MKAKQIYKLFNEKLKQANYTKLTPSVIQSSYNLYEDIILIFVEDTITLLKARQCKNFGAVTSVITEIQNKYQTFCLLVFKDFQADVFDPTLYLRTMQAAMDNHYDPVTSSPLILDAARTFLHKEADYKTFLSKKL